MKINQQLLDGYRHALQACEDLDSLDAVAGDLPAAYREALEDEISDARAQLDEPVRLSELTGAEVIDLIENRDDIQEALELAGYSRKTAEDSEMDELDSDDDEPSAEQQDESDADEQEEDASDEDASDEDDEDASDEDDEDDEDEEPKEASSEDEPSDDEPSDDDEASEDEPSEDEPSEEESPEEESDAYAVRGTLQFNDSGDLTVTNGQDVNLLVEADMLPDDFDLADEATLSSLRQAAQRLGIEDASDMTLDQLAAAFDQYVPPTSNRAEQRGVGAKDMLIRLFQ